MKLLFKLMFKELIKVYIPITVAYVVVLLIPGERVINPAVMLLLPVIAFTIAFPINIYMIKKGKKQDYDFTKNR